MEPTSSNFIIDSLDIMHGISKLPYLRVGINRLLYPQKYIHKGIVKVEEDSFILDNDKQDEMVLSFCELVFSYYGCLHLLDNVISKALWGHTSISYIMDAIKKRFNIVREKKYATFHEVHKFFVNLKDKDDRARILHLFQFSDKTIIEIRDLLEEDDQYKHQLPKTEDDSYEEEFWHLELNDYKFSNKRENEVKPYSEDSHRSFSKLIKRGDYPPLFFAVQVFNHIIKSRLRNDQFLLDFAFVTRDEYKLNTLSLYDARKNIGLVYNHDDFHELIQNSQPFSDCKFAGWVDEWLNNFDSFVKIVYFSNWYNYEINVSICYFMHQEYRDHVTKSVFRFLLTRGWKIPNINENYGINTQFIKEFIGNQLKQTAAVYSIIQEVIPEKSKAMINWWLSKTHYHTIFNKLVEYFTTSNIFKDSVPVGNETVVEHDIDDYEIIGGTTPNEEIKHIDTDYNDLLFLSVVDEKVPGPLSQRVSIRRECLEKLYCILIERGYLDENTDKELFIYRFTGLGEPYSKDQTICWKGVNKLLGYIARCLFTYRSSGTEGLGKFGELFEDEYGNHPYLPSAKHITLEEYNKNPDKRSYQQFKEAIEILQKCGFINVENTSPRGRK